jgi:hypothetical protein
MKFAYLTFFVALFTGFSSYAQNTFPSSGNVGIGTTTPAALFLVSQPTTGVGTISTSASSGIVTGTDTQFRNTFKIGDAITANGETHRITEVTSMTSMTTDAWVNTNSGVFYTLVGGSRFTVRGNGNVSIGLVFPTSPIVYKLEVYNSSNQLGLSGSVNGIGQLVGVDFNQQTTTAGVTRAGGAIKSVAAGAYNGTSSTYASDLAFYSAASGINTERMRILSNGNVGIGTMSPDAKLTVNGTIHTKEVKVDLNVPAPDYVFEKIFRLRTLGEVSHYISLYKHLPDVPSAKSMAENGINISELNMKLLQKVEELTLYLIEQEKKNKEQQAQIDQLIKQVKSLLKK